MSSARAPPPRAGASNAVRALLNAIPGSADSPAGASPSPPRRPPLLPSPGPGPKSGADEAAPSDSVLARAQTVLAAQSARRSPFAAGSGTPVSPSPASAFGAALGGGAPRRTTSPPRTPPTLPSPPPLLEVAPSSPLTSAGSDRRSPTGSPLPPSPTSPRPASVTLLRPSEGESARVREELQLLEAHTGTVQHRPSFSGTISHTSGSPTPSTRSVSPLAMRRDREARDELAVEVAALEARLSELQDSIAEAENTAAGISDANARAEREIKARMLLESRRAASEAEVVSLKALLKEVESARMAAEKVADENADVGNLWKSRSDAFEVAYEKLKAATSAVDTGAIVAAEAAAAAAGAAAAEATAAAAEAAAEAARHAQEATRLRLLVPPLVSALRDIHSEVSVVASVARASSGAPGENWAPVGAVLAPFTTELTTFQHGGGDAGGGSLGEVLAVMSGVTSWVQSSLSKARSALAQSEEAAAAREAEMAALQETVRSLQGAAAAAAEAKASSAAASTELAARTSLVREWEEYALHWEERGREAERVCAESEERAEAAQQAAAAAVNEANVCRAALSTAQTELTALETAYAQAREQLGALEAAAERTKAFEAASERARASAASHSGEGAPASGSRIWKGVVSGSSSVSGSVRGASPPPSPAPAPAPTASVGSTGSVTAERTLLTLIDNLARGASPPSSRADSPVLSPNKGTPRQPPLSPLPAESFRPTSGPPRGVRVEGREATSPAPTVRALTRRAP